MLCVSQHNNKVWIAGKITTWTQMTACAILVMALLVSGRQFMGHYSNPSMQKILDCIAEGSIPRKSRQKHLTNFDPLGK